MPASSSLARVVALVLLPLLIMSGRVAVAVARPSPSDIVAARIRRSSRTEGAAAAFVVVSSRSRANEGYSSPMMTIAGRRRRFSARSRDDAAMQEEKEEEEEERGGEGRSSSELFEPRSILTRMRTGETATTDRRLMTNDDDEASSRRRQQSSGVVQRRHFIVASLALASSAQLGSTSSSSPWGGVPANAATIDARPQQQPPVLTERVNYQPSPINKRYGVSLSEPERIYPLPFITYLSRFLLVFDAECQRWWYNQAQAIPPQSSREDVESIRLGQFGQFAASVEVGLMDFEGGKDGRGGGEEGVQRLIDSLVRRYGPSSLKRTTAMSGDNPAGDPSSPTAAVTDASSERELRKSKEALRQIALLFSLLKDYQPVDTITQLLAQDDDARIVKVDMLDRGAGYPPPAYMAPDVTFPEPPTMGTDFGGSVARGTAVMRESGRVLKVELTQGGRGYLNAPTVEISYPSGGGGGGDAAVDDDKRIRATARAVLGKKKAKGTVERIEILDPGMGYGSLDDIAVAISPPEGEDGVAATAKAILEYEVTGVEITEGGRGYAAERAINIVIDPPPGAARGSGGRVRSAFAVAYPKGKSTSYESFLERSSGGSGSVVSASLSNVDTSQWIAGPTSGQLLALLPSGFGLQYDIALERYILSRSSSSNNWNDILGGSLEGQTFKAINPIFGFRGRSPIEREKSLDVSSVVRFMASGAVCASVAHLVLSPIDVVKTKVQTKPDTYDTGIAGTFRKVLDEEGVATFFDGWEPVFIGYFLAGAVSFFLTEFFKRYFTNLVVTTMMAQQSMSEISAASAASSLEIPLIVASAAVSAFFCCFLLAPFDAVKIRTISQPDYADNIFGVVNRMVKEEGTASLFSAVPVWLVKEIPYNVFKFLVFDTSTEFMYEAFPVAREDIRLSLLVSLLGGTLGGIAATIVSNPADVVVSELKKSKTEMSAWEAVERLQERAGIRAFAKGMTLRMIYYSLLVSLQFFLYDIVRIALGVGTDDMKLYLNVLNAALNERVKQ